MVDFIKPLAIRDFLATESGQKFLAKLEMSGKTEADIDLFTLPFGAGYNLIKNNIQKIIDTVSSITDHVIIVGHVKLSAIDGAEDSDVTKNLDLPGQSKRALSATSDAIGFIFRNEKNDLCINFCSEGIECGARPAHLANKKIVVAEMTEDGSLISHWDRVFPSEKK